MARDAPPPARAWCRRAPGPATRPGPAGWPCGGRRPGRPARHARGRRGRPRALSTAARSASAGSMVGMRCDQLERAGRDRVRQRRRPAWCTPAPGGRPPPGAAARRAGRSSRRGWRPPGARGRPRRRRSPPARRRPSARTCRAPSGRHWRRCRGCRAGSPGSARPASSSTTGSHPHRPYPRPCTSTTGVPSSGPRRSHAIRTPSLSAHWSTVGSRVAGPDRSFRSVCARA